jgi:hypothetical protein
MDALAEQYLSKGPPFLGDSDFHARSAVKDAGARWHHEAKKWKADDVSILCRLIGTGFWTPTGLPPRAALRLPEIVEERARAEEAAAAKRRSDVVLRKAEQERAKVAEKARRDLGVPPNEPELLEQVLAHGVTKELVAESASWSFLGPRSGISDVRRVVRGVSLGVVRWEEITSGDARVRNSKSRPPKSTGMGERGRGVKRGRQAEDARTLGGEPKVQEEQQAPRRLEQLWKPPVSYRYTARCGDCNSTLDSRLQFGLECGCGRLWARCGRCFIPIESGVHCAACA